MPPDLSFQRRWWVLMFFTMAAVAVLLSAQDASGPESIPDSVEALISRIGRYRGKVARHVSIHGRRSQGWSSTTIFGDCSEYLDTSQSSNNPVSTGTTYYLRSSSVEDAPAGTGVRSVRIVYLDSAGAQQISTVATNGTTAVSLGSGYSYFQWMETATRGTSPTAVGNLTISSVTGAPTVAETVELMPAVTTRSRSGRYKVPTGYTAYARSWDNASLGNATMDVRMLANIFTDDRALSGNVFHVQDGMFIQEGAIIRVSLPWLGFPAGTEVRVAAVPSAAAAGNRLDCHVELVLLTN